MKYKFLLIFFTFIFSIQSQSFRNVHGSFTIDDIQKGISFEIFLDRNLYEESEIIPIHFKVKNIGYETFRFYLQQDYKKSFVLEILNERGENIESELKIAYTKEFDLSSIQKNRVEDLEGNPVKEILLHPEEEFIKTYYIKGIPKGNYTLIGYFKPIPFDPKYEKHLRFISKNSFQIFIQKEKSVYKFEDEIELQKEAIPTPEETVNLFLMAEYHKNWDNYLKYIELQEFISSYEFFSNQYENSNPKEKQNVLNQFKKFLTNQNIDPILGFKIKKVEYLERDQAKVFVEVKRGTFNYKVLYLYEYFLKKKQVWKITGVLVSILNKNK